MTMLHRAEQLFRRAESMVLDATWDEVDVVAGFVEGRVR